MNIWPMMRRPGHVPRLLPARRPGEPELHRERFSYLHRPGLDSATVEANIPLQFRACLISVNTRIFYA